MPNHDPAKQAEKVALFRYSVISELLQLTPGTLEYREEMRRLTEKEWNIPGSDRTRIARQTIRDWLQNYDPVVGVDSLRPKIRSDQGKRRRLSVEAAEILLATKREHPKWSVEKVIEKARQKPGMPQEESLPETTVYRLLRDEGLMNRQPAASLQDRRKFQYAYAGEMWMSDVLHGPSVPDEKGRRRKTYLLALLDDATRLIPHAEFAYSESETDFLLALKEGVLRRGVPQRLYVDNGACYRSHQLQLIVANLECHLIHATPYAPQGKGKIERFFRTVRKKFLDQFEDQEATSLSELNHQLHDWLQNEYHRTPHYGINHQTPLDKWCQTLDQRRQPPSLDRLEEIFLFEAQRKVRKDCTVALKKRFYEVETILVGKTVTLSYDPSQPERPLKVSYQGQPYQPAHPVDLASNARAKRRKARSKIKYS